jgi:hypothetical protein
MALGGTLLASTASAQGGYEIGPRDVVHLVVIGQDSLTGDFAVDPDGMLTLPTATSGGRRSRSRSRSIRASACSSRERWLVRVPIP